MDQKLTNVQVLSLSQPTSPSENTPPTALSFTNAATVPADGVYGPWEVRAVHREGTSQISGHRDLSKHLNSCMYQYTATALSYTWKKT